LSKIHRVLAGRRLGEISDDVFREAGIDTRAIARARRFVFRCKADLRHIVRPGSTGSKLGRAISADAPTNRRILKVAEALLIIGMHLQGRLAPSGLELIEHPSGAGRFLRCRWRKALHDRWLRAPVLYLDAAGTASLAIAKAWLPEIELAVEARANAIHMRVTQIVDSQMSYRKILDDATAEKLAGIIETRGPGDLVICPKRLRDVSHLMKKLPGWKLWNFGAIRGRDDAREIRHLVVISRPLPAPAEAETIFGRGVQWLPAGELFPRDAIGRLMADGTGRRSLAYRHPDPVVEAVSFSICEGELLQAIGRGRGVRRTEDASLDVLILTDVPLPLAVDATTNWKELCDAAGPIEVLTQKGIVPLDYAGIAAALPDWFTDARAALE
jgi:hypothetical protein